MTAEPNDFYPAELERIAAGILDGLGYQDLPAVRTMRQAAALIRSQAEKIARDREVFAQIEWMAEVQGYAACAWCLERKKDGHAPDCRLKAELGD